MNTAMKTEICKEKTEKRKEKKETIKGCVWKNRGLSSHPFWFKVGCLDWQVVNAQKMFKFGKMNKELKCQFCGKPIDFQGAGKK